MLRERESTNSFHGPRHYIPIPEGLAGPYISEAVVRFETISDLKDDLKEILPIFRLFSKS